jgi:hypothetical protein
LKLFEIILRLKKCIKALKKETIMLEGYLENESYKNALSDFRAVAVDYN